MDGNGRWAEARGKKRSAGHKQGAETAKQIVLAAAKHPRIAHVTLYAFSEENWQRPEDEVKDLMGLMRFYLGQEIKALHKHGVAVDVIGDVSKLSSDMRNKIAAASKETSESTALQVHIALSYGARQELTQAAKNMAAAGAEELAPFLYTNNVPDPDLLIRTGGEKRLSNFLLWQCAYTELYFTDILWPDFTGEDVEDALADFDARHRRYGKL